MKLILPIFLAAALLSATSASALTDAQKCSSFKWKVAGGHAECLLKEDAKAIKTGKEPDYSSCERKLTIKYTRAELKWACDVEGEVTNVSNLLNTCTEGVRNTTTSNALSVVGVSPGWTCTGPAPDNCEPICGDSLTVGPEFCDDGNATGSDGCSADCLSGCGDGVFEPAEGEECDDGNDATDDGCTPECLVESCGDGVQQASEACDDFNNDDGDGCSADCQSDETCGNGIVDLAVGEICDDSNEIGTDECGNDCLGPAWEGSATFTNCGSEGRLGPDQAACDAAYSGTELGEAGTVLVEGGTQSWAAPTAGWYRIEVLGAAGRWHCGSSEGLGARMRGDFYFPSGQRLNLIVGQQGAKSTYNWNCRNGGAGGGGGSFVWLEGAASPIMAAGGGGGEGPSVSIGNPHLNGQHGAVGEGGTSSTDGQGLGGVGGSDAPDSGGLGWSTVAVDPAGAEANCSDYAGAGGFGGGGGAFCHRGGGGGGFSGGGVAASGYSGGGGGGSYNSGTNQVNESGANYGQGRIVISARPENDN